MPYRGLAGRTPAASYADLLQIGNDGGGLPSSGVMSVCDGAGNESKLKLGQSQSSIDFGGGILRNAIVQGGCDAYATSTLANGNSFSLNLFSTKNIVFEMLEKNGSSTICTNCCSGTSTSAGVNTINLNFSPSLTLASSELGYTPLVGGKTTVTFVIPSATITDLCRIVFASASGTVHGQYDTCIDPTPVRFAIYDVYTIPTSGSYKFVIKQSMVVI